MLGTDRHQARGRLPAHSRIHLFVRRGLSEGWDLCLSDHAEIGYGVLSGLPHRPVAKVCQAGYPLGSRRRPQPSLQRPRASRQYLATLPPAILARDQAEGKSLGRNPRKNLEELRSPINRRRARQARACDPLRRTQSKNRKIHHLIPLHPKVTLMWKWYETWSFVLTTALELSLPVVAFDHGAPSERLKKRDSLILCYRRRS